MKATWRHIRYTIIMNNLSYIYQLLFFFNYTYLLIMAAFLGKLNTFAIVSKFCAIPERIYRHIFQRIIFDV